MEVVHMSVCDGAFALGTAAHKFRPRKFWRAEERREDMDWGSYNFEHCMDCVLEKPRVRWCDNIVKFKDGFILEPKTAPKAMKSTSIMFVFEERRNEL